MPTKEYQRNWRANHPIECHRYSRNYIEKHPEKAKEKNRRRNKIPKRKEYHKKYMRKYSKIESHKIKGRIRLETLRIYGKVPEGYERHHINYDSPHNFILLPIKEHKQIHRDLLN